MSPRIFRGVLMVLLLAGAPSGCVHVDPNTNDVLPRGDQRYEFETVNRRAKELKNGMTKFSVMMMLGSPAEKSGDGAIWVYLPERPAVLIPGRALRLEFKDGVLVEHGYRAVILGQDL